MSATSKDGLFAVCGSFTGLSTISVALRFYGRKLHGTGLGVDDWSTLFGVVSTQYLDYRSGRRED